MSEKKVRFPKRNKIMGILVLIVFIVSVLTFRLIENYSWIDSFYLLIVTISTVGFGDITPTEDITKIVLIILIITGISSIALTSEAIVDSLIKSSNVNYKIPNKKIKDIEHIVIIGLCPVAEKVAILCNERGFKVIILVNDENKVDSARKLGFESYLVHYDSPITFDIINIEKAKALYLFVEDDNLTIKITMIAREFSEELPVFAETTPILSIEFGELVGITRTYQTERLLGSFLSVSNQISESMIIPNQESPDSVLRIIMAKKWFYRDKMNYGKNIVFGYIPIDFSESYSIKDDIEIDKLDDNVMLFIISLPPLGDHFNKGIKRKEINNKVWICGFSEYIENILDFITFDKKNISIITFSKNDIERIEILGYHAVYCDRKDVEAIIDENFSDNDLVINLFRKIPDALLMNVMIRKSRYFPKIIQVTQFANEEKLFRKSGVNIVIDPNVIMARGMLLILLKKLNLSVSSINGTQHVFEHKINNKDKFDGKSFDEIIKLGFTVVAYKKNGVNKLYRGCDCNKFKEGDHIVLSSNFTSYRKIETSH